MGGALTARGVAGRVWPICAAVAALVLLLPPAGHAEQDEKGAPPSPEIQAILDRLDRAQEAIQTFQADVVETRTLALLAKPQTFRGRLSFERPGKIRWEYTSPEKRVYVLAEGDLTGWIPAKNRVEKISIARYERRIRRIIAFGQDSKVLLRDFKITTGAAGSGRDELILTPRSRRMERRLRQIRLTIDHRSGFVQRIQYVTKEGNQVTLELSNTLVNRALAPETFVLKTPPGARVVRGLPSLGFEEGASDADSSEEF